MKQTIIIQAGEDRSFFWEDFGDCKIQGFKVEEEFSMPEGSEHQLMVRGWRCGVISFWPATASLVWELFKAMRFEPAIQLTYKGLMMLTVSNYGPGAAKVTITPKVLDL